MEDTKVQHSNTSILLISRSCMVSFDVDRASQEILLPLGSALQRYNEGVWNNSSTSLLADFKVEEGMKKPVRASF